MSNTPKKISDVYKPFGEFGDEPKVNYFEYYEDKKPKRMFAKTNPDDRNSFLEVSKSNFYLNSEDDTDNSKNENLTDSLILMFNSEEIRRLYPSKFRKWDGRREKERRIRRK